MVSLVNYVKNYKDNTIVEEVKFKPNTGYKGRTTIQLFNASSGELELEAVSENVICDWVAKTGFKNTFAANLGATTADDLLKPFYYLVLTDAVIPEDASAREIVGNPIGFAIKDTAYSGTATNRGTCNLSETFSGKLSTIGKTTSHYVFDFPTHAANGVIRTVYWAPLVLSCVDSTDNNTRGIFNASIAFDSTRKDMYKSSDPLVYNAYMWMYAVSAKYGKYIQSSNMFYGIAAQNSILTFAGFNYATPSLSSYDYYGCTYADGSSFTSYPANYCAYIDENNETFKVLFYTGNSVAYKDMPLRYTYYEFTFNFNGSFVSSRFFDRTQSYYGGVDVTKSWFYDNNGNLCATFYGGTATERINKMFKFTTDLGSTSTIDLTDLLVSQFNKYYRTDTYNSTNVDVKASYIKGIDVCQDGLMLMVITGLISSDASFLINSNTLEPIYGNYCYLTPVSAAYILNYFSGSPVTFRTSVIQQTSNYIAMHKGSWVTPPSAQNLLPSNVVKTDAHTMKIQYDFIIDDVDIFPAYAPTNG